MTLHYKLVRSTAFWLLSALALSLPASGQVDRRYSPRQAYTSGSRELIADVEFQMNADFVRMGATSPFVNEVNGKRKKRIIDLIKNQYFIHDDSVETYVNNVIARIVTSNALPATQRRALVMASASVNAYCYAGGLYVATIGLLGRVYNEDQLAFILAHEIAHDELGHIHEGIFLQEQADIAKKAREQVKKVFDGEVNAEEIEEFRSVLYGVTKFNRRRELEADSMALIYLRAAKYDRTKATSALAVLKASLAPKTDIGPELFDPFNPDAYPFQDYWLRQQPSVLRRKPSSGTFMFSLDSLESHPDIDLRIETVKNYFPGGWEDEAHQPEAFIKAVTTTAEFETVESAFRQHAYDRCLYYALQLLVRYPGNSYLTSRIGKIMVDYAEGTLHITPYTSGYSDEMRIVHDFLLNLTERERREVAFYFISNQKYFHPEEKSHWYLLWKIADLTYRNEIRNDAKKHFAQAFGTSISSYEYR
jgi:Zn-dependent protease with chaperone function